MPVTNPESRKRLAALRERLAEGREQTIWCRELHPESKRVCRLPGWPHTDHVATTPTGGDQRWSSATTKERE